MAHLPIIEPSAGGVVALEDPTAQSIAAYGTLSAPGETDLFEFVAGAEADLPFEVLVPVRESAASFHPTATVTTEQGTYAIETPVAGRTVFFESFSVENLYDGTEQVIRVRAGERVRVAISHPGGGTGDYVLGIGTVEAFAGRALAPILADVVQLKLGLVGGKQVPWGAVFGLFLLMAGYAVGLGAVTVIDLHGFLARRSGYWTEATIRAHKVTKPLIWAGMATAVAGGVLRFSSVGFTGLVPLLAACAVALVANGAYLSFVVSPALLARERAGKASEILPAPMQRRIVTSFVISLAGWWGSLFLLAWQLTVLR